MSIKLMTVVWELDLPPGEKLVLLALADQANDEGTHCWPSVATISKRSGQNERTVRRALRSLEGKGHLTCNERRGTSTNYVVHPGHDAPPVKLPPLTKTTRTPDTMPPHPGHHAPPPLNEPLEPSKEIAENDNPILKPEHVIEAYNELAERKGLRKAIKITDERKRKLALAVKRNTVAEFQEALAAIERSKFLCGENDRGWRADFDFLLQPKTFTKLIEGCYG